MKCGPPNHATRKRVSYFNMKRAQRSAIVDIPILATLHPNSGFSLTTLSSLIVKSAGCNASDLRNDRDPDLHLLGVLPRCNSLQLMSCKSGGTVLWVLTG